MAGKKNRRTTPEESRTTAEYYKLHTAAVRDLVDADESNSPEVPEEELLKYRSGPKLRLSDWVKAILIKMWFAGSVCFFIFWGLSSYIGARLDLLFVFALALGVVTDVLTNNILRYYAKTVGGNDRWMMFPQKGYITFPLNILYAMILLFCVDMFYTLLNLSLSAIGDGGLTIGVGPILFGVVYTAFDLLFITIKRTLRQIVRDAMKNAKGQ
ncbi:MAG: hypothetical protein IJ649_01265 [Oscillospiraceae bacterium]|nr:hypothetical protein [Oscillospiraceae bacterium]